MRITKKNHTNMYHLTVVNIILVDGQRNYITTLLKKDQYSGNTPFPLSKGVNLRRKTFIFGIYLHTVVDNWNAYLTLEISNDCKINYVDKYLKMI